jgi:hypothetical protein
MQSTADPMICQVSFVTAYSKRQMYLSYWDKIGECEKGNINTKWKEHQKLIHSQSITVSI